MALLRLYILNTLSSQISPELSSISTPILLFLPCPPFHDKGHSHLDPSITTVTIPLPPFEEQKLFMLENYLQTVLWDVEGDREYEVHRTKGYINVSDGKPRVVQGVREIL